MTPVSSTCADCGGECHTTYGQRYLGDDLVWSQSTRCTNCELALEGDGHGIPPETVRAWVIDADGRWALRVNVNGSQRVSACKILHCDLNTTMAEVRPMKDRMPGIVYTGTRAEMDWLSSRLRQFDFDATFDRVDDDESMRRLDITLIDLSEN